MTDPAVLARFSDDELAAFQTLPADWYDGAAALEGEADRSLGGRIDFQTPVGNFWSPPDPVTLMFDIARGTAEAVGTPQGRREIAAARDIALLSGRVDSLPVARQRAWAGVIDRLQADMRTDGEGRGLIDHLPGNPYGVGSGWAVLATRGGGAGAQARALYWDYIHRRRAVAPGYMAEMGADDDAFNAAIDAGVRAELATLERQAGDNLAAQLIGAVIGSASDPLTLMTLPMGGMAARSVVQAGLREAALNVGVEAVATPFIARRAEQLDREMTVGDIATNLAAAGVLGGAIGVAGHGLERLLQRPLGSLTDRESREVFEALVPQDRRTPEQQDALAVLAEAESVAASNRLPDTVAGRIAHQEALSVAVEQVEAGLPVDLAASRAALEELDLTARELGWIDVIDEARDLVRAQLGPPPPAPRGVLETLLANHVRINRAEGLMASAFNENDLATYKQLRLLVRARRGQNLEEVGDILRAEGYPVRQTDDGRADPDSVAALIAEDLRRRNMGDRGLPPPDNYDVEASWRSWHHAMDNPLSILDPLTRADLKMKHLDDIDVLDDAEIDAFERAAIQAEEKFIREASDYEDFDDIPFDYDAADAGVRPAERAGAGPDGGAAAGQPAGERSGEGLGADAAGALRRAGPAAPEGLSAAAEDALAGYDAPGGAAQAAQADLLRHEIDARLAEAAQGSFDPALIRLSDDGDVLNAADVLAQLDEEAAALDALEACLRPAGAGVAGAA